MTRAYYNEIDTGAAAWLRELIRDGLIAPGDVDERRVTQDQSLKDRSSYDQAEHDRSGIIPTPVPANANLQPCDALQGVRVPACVQYRELLFLRTTRTLLGRSGLSDRIAHCLNRAASSPSSLLDKSFPSSVAEGETLVPNERCDHGDTWQNRATYCTGLDLSGKPSRTHGKRDVLDLLDDAISCIAPCIDQSSTSCVSVIRANSPHTARNYVFYSCPNTTISYGVSQ